ncbi:hypothetical protein [Treponema socranskii]|uniref:hypothetical protein n=1 Tax=Treponema socranskii TaxID=53419 RepID=UPI003D938CA3
MIYFVDADTRRAVGAGNAAARDSAVGYHKRNICAEKYNASPHERQASFRAGHGNQFLKKGFDIHNYYDAKLGKSVIS